MKHTVKITLILLLFFVFSQIFGLFLVHKNMEVEKDVSGKVINVTFSDTILGESPDTTPMETFVMLLLGILLGTLAALFLIKYNLFKLWNLWFFIAVFLSISVSLGVFIDRTIAFILGFVLTYLKNKKPNILTHNLSELLIYPGITLIFAPLLNLYWIILLLIIISFYDMYAVWYSKHMIKLAEFQSSSDKFAGLMIRYDRKEEVKVKKTPKKSKSAKKVKIESKRAVLGGGDIFFPLLFSGILLQHLVLVNGLDKLLALFLCLIITFFTTISLALLFYFSKKDRYYPAMPFISGGCFLGLIVIKLIIHYI